MIAYHFPPMQGSSGIQRTLKFAQYLPQHGWEAIILSVNLRAYAATSTGQLPEINAAMTVRRSFALDAARHMALGGRYPAWLALPDRWSSWWLSAVPAGLRLIRQYRPDVIWSTYPIATAHLIALTLQRLSGLPWIADQRDPMSENNGGKPYPADARTRRLHQWLEHNIAEHSAAVVCTTPGAMGNYRARFPQLEDRLSLIENAYDESNFTLAGATPAAARQPGAPFKLLHSGILYPSERDPSALFEALAKLRDDNAIGAHDFQLLLRASGHDRYLRGMLQQFAIEDLVQLAPTLPYQAALADMLDADGLLLLQAAHCNHQIPAKLYEYLRARRPLLALTDLAGDSAAKLRSCGIDTIAPLNSPAGIAHALPRFLALARSHQAPLADSDTIAQQSRQARTTVLAGLLDRISHRETP
ncbi:glycosyltransferase protein [Janthinobacterium agaricidamnosum NBRC 102515 = DSM 9628]|uniref:Glycosyltransferase protein n=2 Tax=Janthinobacterium agaricidamnosum TaxID=55508 RepID=W0V6Q5_9BURK|nr:glycosyltransferase protein [Janthinobacterium agaricidamnosum NBRC 102515 = DSM 9628]